MKPDALISLCRNSSERRPVCFVVVVALLIVLDKVSRPAGGLQEPCPSACRAVVRLFRLKSGIARIGTLWRIISKEHGCLSFAVRLHTRR